MEKMQLQLLVQQQGQISGFSYPFARLLIDRLKDLFDKDRVFEDGKEKASKEEKGGYSSTLTAEAQSLINHLEKQIISSRTSATPTGIATFINRVKEFLAIFEP